MQADRFSRRVARGEVMPRTRSSVWRRLRAALFCSLCALLPAQAIAITTSPFGANGQGGALNGQVFDVGPGGSVFELDAFVDVGGQDLNGPGTVGTAARLSSDGVPGGLGFSFGSSLQDGGTDILLSYSFTNNTGAALSSVSFVSFLDAEIDEPTTTFFNEVVTTAGVLALGQSFEADEPGYAFGDIVTNARLAALDGTNAVAPGSPEDASMALGWGFALGVGETATIEVLVSEDMDSIGTFSMTQSDTTSTGTTITFSSALGIQGGPSDPAVPEPSAALVFAAGLLVCARALRRPVRQSGH